MKRIPGNAKQVLIRLVQAELMRQGVSENNAIGSAFKIADALERSGALKIASIVGPRGGSEEPETVPTVPEDRSVALPTGPKLPKVPGE